MHVPADAFPCRFGFTLRWASIGPPRTRKLIDGAQLRIYDGSGNLLHETNEMVLAKPPSIFTWPTTSNRGYVLYPQKDLLEFAFPEGKIASGFAENKDFIIRIDSGRSLVPIWWFK